MKSEWFEKIEKYMDSEEFQKDLDDWFEKTQVKRKLRNRHIKKLHQYHGSNIDPFIEKLITKYYSKEYSDREMKCGYYDGRETLFWLLFDYAKKHGKKCNNKKYWNTFTSEAYYIGSYIIQIMYGQGVAIRIDKR
jgi:hypothetical protein